MASLCAGDRVLDNDVDLLQVFASHRHAAKKDAALTARLSSLSFVTFKHLEMPRPPVKHRPGWVLAQVRRRRGGAALLPL